MDESGKMISLEQDIAQSMERAMIFGEFLSWLSGDAVPARTVAATPSNPQAVSPLRASIPIARNDR